MFVFLLKLNIMKANKVFIVLLFVFLQVFSFAQMVLQFAYIC
jgi:hypothetical protein